jgi:5-methylthioadenosine/S-adenosylhomocysteine deaminase
MVDILIEGGIIFTMDPEWKVFPNGAVAVQGDRIIEVGDTDNLKKKYPSPKKVINANYSLISLTEYILLGTHREEA